MRQPVSRVEGVLVGAGSKNSEDVIKRSGRTPIARKTTSPLLRPAVRAGFSGECDMVCDVYHMTVSFV